MKQVVCINPRGYRLTQGREYTVANNPTRGFYRVENDRGSHQLYHRDLFQDVVVEPVEDSADTIFDSLNISSHADNNNNLTIQLVIDDNNISFTVSPQSENRSRISCGINYFNNINTVLESVTEQIPNRDNIRERVLCAIIKSALTIRNTGIIQISTNITGNNNIELLHSSIELLKNEYRIDTMLSHNPNSNNEIVLYSILISPSNLEEEDDVEDILDINQL